MQICLHAVQIAGKPVLHQAPLQINKKLWHCNGRCKFWENIELKKIQIWKDKFKDIVIKHFLFIISMLSKYSIYIFHGEKLFQITQKMK
jgi:hypothetical protein